MEVRCERCGTEYEFDDALVSERGTSVKCTECANEFRVLPRGGLTESGPKDTWHVRRVDGLELKFTSLRELQRSIRTRDITKDDRLWREGESMSRPLGSIPELEELLRGTWHDSTHAPMNRPRGNQNPSRPALDAKEIPRAPKMPARIDTLRPPNAALPPPPPPESDPATLQRFTVPEARAELETDEPSPTHPTRAPIDEPMETSSPLPPLARYDSLPSIPDDERLYVDSAASDRGVPISLEHGGAPRRRRVGGWIVSLVLLGGVAVLGLAVARPYLVAKQGKTAPPIDPRAADLLSAADRAYSAGNLELAKEDVDKASALAEQSPQVLLARARVAVARADLPWLRVKLLPPDAADDIHATQASATELATTAESLASSSIAATPNDPAAVRTQIDALRLSGRSADGRALVTRIAQGQGGTSADHASAANGSSEPETAYALAALDAAEPLPPWRTVIDRLRVAASAEGELGRARSLLVYALAKSGDVAAARSEVDKMALFSRPHPLTSLLRSFVQKQPAAIDGGAPSAMASPSGLTAIDVNSLPRSAAPGTAGGSGGGAGDSRTLDAQGDTARQAGDYPKAAALYAQALERSPNDSEALGGLGDVARARGDFEGAKTSYRRALMANPQYLPAMVGLADVEYDSGDKAAAQQTYKEIADHFPDGSYPARVKQRAEGGASSGSTATASPAGSTTTATTTPAAPAREAGAPAAATTGTNEPEEPSP